MPYLRALIRLSSYPLRNYEKQFAVDSSGFSENEFERYFDVRNAKMNKRREYKKLHVAVGTRTHIITGVEVTDGFANDNPQFSSLLQQTVMIFPNIEEISADKGYSSRKNHQIVAELNAIPFIPFKKHVNKRPQGFGIWNKMLMLFLKNPDKFNEHYHRRSNVESVFSMVKRNLDHTIRAKNDIAQFNEILVKCLIHNIIVLIMESFEIGIEINFNICAELLPAQIKA